MSRVCHETGRNVENPYHVMSAVIRDPESGKVAYSNLEVSLCDATFKKVESEVNFPGQIKINVIREKRIIEYAK